MQYMKKRTLTSSTDLTGRSQLILIRRYLWYDLELKVTWLSENVINNFVNTLEPQHPILDTKITFLSRLVPDITDHAYVL